MTAKKKTYSLCRIRENYSYTVQEIADLFGVTIATVRRWIRTDGLKRIPKVRPHLVHSSDLRCFLEQRQNANKHVCAENEVYCTGCRSPQIPEPGSGNITERPNKTIHFKSKCGVCSRRINRYIRRVDWSQNHPLAAYLKDAPANPNESQRSPRKCALQKKGQLCLNITP
jgi:hypothetical protein